MATLSPEAKAYLYELYTLTGGDPGAQVSMYDVGKALGMERNDAASMAESLYVESFAELKTLSGGIGITREGLNILEIKIPAAPGEALSLGKAPILADEGKNSLDKILLEIKKAVTDTKMSFPQIEEILMDMKTIEVQMLSPRPKTGIIREILRSIHLSLEASGPKGLTEKLKALVSS